jgi:hypothetical protein
MASAPSSSRLRPCAPSKEALLQLLEAVGFLTRAEGEAGLGLPAPVPAGGWTRWFSRLVREGRAVTLHDPAGGRRLWVSVARVDWFALVAPAWQPRPIPGAAPRDALPSDRGAVWQWLVQARRAVDGEAACDRVMETFRLDGPRRVAGAEAS